LESSEGDHFYLVVRHTSLLRFLKLRRLSTSRFTAAFAGKDFIDRRFSGMDMSSDPLPNCDGPRVLFFPVSF